MNRTKRCPICGCIMDRNSYFNRWICSSTKCNHTIDLKQRDQEKTLESLMEIVDEILYYVDKNTSSDISKLKDTMWQLKSDWYDNE